MRVIIAAGGSGGHIYPALGIIDKIKKMEPKSEFLYVGTHNRMEKDIVPKTKIPFMSLEVYGLRRKITLQNFKSILFFLKAIKQMKKTIKYFKPDIVIGVGGYVSAPVVYAAHRLKIPTFIHEQNSEPGLSNKFLMRFADKIGISMKESKEFFPNDKVVFTGNPCGERVYNAKKKSKKYFGFDNKKKLVLMVMGSIGSGTIAEAMKIIIPMLTDIDYEVAFVTGKRDYEEFKNIKCPENVKILEYVDNMGEFLKSTDLVITRSGASMLSEITVLGIPSILIPSPYVANDEQNKNAKVLEAAGAAVILDEKDFDYNNLTKEIKNILEDKACLKSMKKASETLGVKDSGDLIYKVLKTLVTKGE